MDHATFISQLPGATRAQLNTPSDRAGLGHLALHLGLIVLLGAAIGLRVPFWPVLLLPQGVLLVFLFTLAHECTHRTPFATPWLNEGVGHVAGLVLLLPFAWFRYFHMAHHKYTHDPARDPELARPPPASWRAWVWHVSGIPYWQAQIALLLRLAWGRETAPYLPPRALPRLRRAAGLMLLAYAAVLCSLLVSPLLLWLWIVPVVLGQPVLRLYLLAEHGDCPHVSDMFLNTRTTFTTRIVRFLAWNMPFHAEHHTLPQVPFYRLPQVHALMRAHLRQTANGYGAFTRAYLARRR